MLRTWRNGHAKQLGRVPYALFTNRQAVEMVQTMPASKSALKEIKGIGAARVDEWGELLLAVLVTLAEPAKSAASEPSPTTPEVAEQLATRDKIVTTPPERDADA